MMVGAVVDTCEEFAVSLFDESPEGGIFIGDLLLKGVETLLQLRLSTPPGSAKSGQKRGVCGGGCGGGDGRP
jgi:hypothetical protein